MSVSFDFTGQVVMVTGASGALGSAVVRAFDAAGATVAGVGGPRGSTTAAPDWRGTFYRADLTDEAAVAATVESAVDDHGGLDALCNVAGTWRGGHPIDETDVDEYDLLLDVNLKTTFLTSKHAIPHLRARDGALVSVSAKSGRQGGPGDGPYRASKAGVRLLTETIAAENRGRLRANAVVPSIIDTPANREAMPDADHDRWPTPDDIAQVVLFLCSDAARVVSGAAVPVYGEA